MITPAAIAYAEKKRARLAAEAAQQRRWEAQQTQHVSDDEYFVDIIQTSCQHEKITLEVVQTEDGIKFRPSDTPSVDLEKAIRAMTPKQREIYIVKGH